MTPARTESMISDVTQIIRTISPATLSSPIEPYLTLGPSSAQPYVPPTVTYSTPYELIYATDDEQESENINHDLGQICEQSGNSNTQAFGYLTTASRPQSEDVSNYHANTTTQLTDNASRTHTNVMEGTWIVTTLRCVIHPMIFLPTRHRHHLIR